MRILAVKRVVEEGEDPSEVMRSLGLCRTSIDPWLRKFHEEGWDALVERIAQGREPKLNDKQRPQVKRWILGKDPRQYGFDFGLWTRRIVQALIEDKMKVELGWTAVGRLLASLDASSGGSRPSGWPATGECDLTCSGALSSWFLNIMTY